MLIQITQLNKKLKRKRTWSFVVEFDWETFKFEECRNVLKFCRYNEDTLEGKPVKYYDITSNQFNCSSSVALPSDSIKEKALAKMMESWAVVVPKKKVRKKK